MWELGRHRLLCGDARREAAYNKLMAGSRAAMVFADPPYNVSVKSVQGRGSRKHREFAMASGEMAGSEFIEFLDEHAFTCRNAFGRRRHPLCVHGLAPHFRDLPGWKSRLLRAQERRRLEQDECRSGQLLPLPARAHFRLQERRRTAHQQLRAWAARPQSLECLDLCRRKFLSRGRLDDLSIHPTVKPVALVADAMRDCTRRGDIVLDPFMGSGTTILAAEHVGRRAYGLELDPLYVDAAVRRWQNFTKRDAVLSGSQRTFDEVERSRASAKRSRRK